ncbi:MAG: isoprenyl transferase [Ancrocorticia sp.]|jgi:short-chain Z-isoprenyl diphosphate synthase|nr:isoprenyl transferase [Ancrocorticia sp.]MCI1896658.1 isoprenyl transferase [Ancrocorticia sp.]MCI1933414.1 isoprenyl transferase [Ancrocorticia sp.]MCI1964481.1 isoprenyl transferase [Ancrocorticia sp.]MCI2002212.1 isoprenyl transferase [Ancrocorticia sp.]
MGWKGGIVQAPAFLYSLYERRLQRQLDPAQLPRHIAVMLDGNRRWAREVGQSASYGHRKGALKISELLDWCNEVGIQIVTLWLLSTDNLNREKEELEELVGIIADTVDSLAESGQWSLHMVGNLELIPRDCADRLRAAEQRTAAVSGMRVNIAVGYGGRQEITDAVRELLLERAAKGETIEQVARSVSLDDITAHLYTKGQPDPDLVIRTSGEQRLSGFMLWQSVHTELYFCEAYWPDFRRTDFLRALRDYGQRERRMGL